MGFEDIFDFDGDGKLNVIEQATAYEVLFGDHEKQDGGGYHTPFDDEDLPDSCGEYYNYDEDDEYDEDDYAGDEFDDEDEDFFEDEEEEAPIGGEPYRERYAKIIDLISETMENVEDLLSDLEMDVSDSDKRYAMIDALENAKIDLDLLTVDLENVLE